MPSIKFKHPETGEWTKVGVPMADAQGMQMELLWENASPASGFVAQTLALDSSGYSALIIVARYSTDSYLLPPAIVYKSQEKLIGMICGYDNIYRYIESANDNEVVFKDCHYPTGTIRNDNAIPYKIYGLKE